MKVRKTLLPLVALLLPVSVAAQELPATTDSEAARAAFEEGLTLFQNLRADEARSSFDRAIQADTEFALAHLYRGLTGESWLEYEQHVQRAAELAGEASEGERMLIMSYKASADGDQERRDELRAQLAEKYPRDARVAFLHAQTQDDPQEQVRMFERVVDLNPQYAPAYNSLGYAYRAVGDFEKAEQAFQQYIELLPNEPNPYDSMADLYMKAGRFEEAIGSYEQALQRSDRFVVSQQKIGESLDLMGRHEEARRAYEKFLRMEETPAHRIEANLALARSHLLQGQYEQAMQKSGEAQSLAQEVGVPGAAFINLERSWVAQEHDRLDDAERYNAQAKDIMAQADFPPNVRRNFDNAVLFNEAMIAARRGEHETAVQKADAYRKKAEEGSGQPSMEDYHELVGMIHFFHGDYQEAVGHLEKGNPEGAYAKYYMGLAQAEAGNEAEAAKLIEEAANFNEGGLGFALVRSKAKQWLEERSSD